jgi:alpha-tubulin suppressor-like RCC1 family protein
LACLLPALLAGLGSSGAVQAQSIATGSRHGLALQPDGSVLAWGDNRQAQLGFGKVVYSEVAGEIALPSRAVAVRASSAGVLVLDADGNVWSWGTNRKGQLGDGTLADRSTPKVIFRGATAITNGDEYLPSFLIDKDGQPWWWGPLPSGEDAALPRRAAQVPARLTRVEQGGKTTIALDEQGRVWSWGEGVACAASPEFTGPVAMADLPPITDIAIAANPSSRATPLNQYPQFPRSLVYGMDRDGRVWKWGTEPGFPSQQSLPPPPQTFCPPVQTPQNLSGFFYRLRTHPDLARSGVVIQRTIPAAWSTLGLTAGGDLWQWKDVIEGEAPGVRLTLRRVATDVIDASGYASEGIYLRPGLLYITRDGKLYGMGSNTSGHLATPASQINGLSSPGRVALPAGAASVHAQPTGSYALLNDGRIFAWGLGAAVFDLARYFDMGHYSQTPTHFPLPAPVVKLAVGLDQWLAVDASGSVWSSNGWGSEIRPGNAYQAAMVSRSTGMPLARDAAVGSYDYGAILGVDGSVWTVGSGAGIAPPPPGIGMAEFFAWQALPRKVLGLPHSIVQVASIGDVSVKASYALDASGGVWFWGDRTFYGIAGQDGAALPFVERTVNTPMLLPLGQKATAIRTHDLSFCAVLEDGSAQCYGKFFNEHLGQQLRLHAPIRELSIGADEQTLGLARGKRSGTVHLRLADGTVWAWGQGRYGQLGSGTFANAAEPVPVLNEAGTGDLDLDPVTPNVATASRPPFRVKTRLVGNLRTLSFDADVFGTAAGSGAGNGTTNLYAFATADLDTWMQLDGQGQWSLLRAPVPAAAGNVPLAGEGQSVPLPILPQFVGTGLAGVRVFVGQGRDAQEMLQAQRFREVLELAPED